MSVGMVRRNAKEAKLKPAWARDDYECDVRHVDESTLNRWCVNYIRHELTDYDTDLYEGKGQVSIRDEYTRYRNAALNAIATAYPMLASECDWQSRR